MRAEEFLEVLDAERGNAAVMASSGVSGALWRYGHRPRTLYNMGMSYTAAACCGLAMTRPDMKVIAIEGDGSYLMGLATLATIGRYAPANLCVVVFNNRTYLPTGTSGELPSAAAYGCDLAGFAVAAGLKEVAECNSQQELATALRSAMGGDSPAVVVANVDLQRETWQLDGKARIPRRSSAAEEFRADIGSYARPSDVARELVELDPASQSEWVTKAQGWRSGGTIYRAIRDAGIDFLVYLPEGLLYPVQVMSERDAAMQAICCTREDEGVAIASGAALAGRSAAILCEGTGIGMSASALAGLITRQTPILVISSHSQSLGIRRPWDEIASMANEPVVRALGMSVAVLSSPAMASVAIKESVRETRITGKPAAVVVPPHVMDDVDA